MTKPNNAKATALAAKKAAGVKALAPTPAEIAERMKAAIKSPEWERHFELLEAAKASPVGKLLDQLALKDLVSLEQWVPRDSDSEHAQEVWKCIELARTAADSMMANYWLRRAMVYSKDLMLWDDSDLGQRHRKSQSERAKSGGKTDEGKRKRIAAEYWHRVANGEKYCALKSLGAQYNLTSRQIKNIAEKFRPKLN